MMSENKNLTLDEVSSGEKFTVTFTDRLGVTIEMVGHGSWQPMHYHLVTSEEYFISAGVLILAVLNEYDKISLRVYRTDESFICKPCTVHAVYRAAGTLFGIVRTVLNGIESKEDFYPESSLDSEIQQINLRGLLYDKIL